MFFSRVRSRFGRAFGRPFDFFINRQNSCCSFWVRLAWTRSRPLAPSQSTTAHTILQGIRLQVAGTARRMIQAGISGGWVLIGRQLERAVAHGGEVALLDR